MLKTFKYSQLLMGNELSPTNGLIDLMAGINILSKLIRQFEGRRGELYTIIISHPIYISHPIMIVNGDR